MASRKSEPSTGGTWMFYSVSCGETWQVRKQLVTVTADGFRVSGDQLIADGLTQAQATRRLHIETNAQEARQRAEGSDEGKCIGARRKTP